VASYIDPLIAFVSANAWLAYLTLFLAALLEASESSGQLKQVELVEVLEPLELRPRHRLQLGLEDRHAADYSLSASASWSNQGGGVRASAMSIEKAVMTYLKGWTLASQNAQPWDPGACRRR